MATPVYVAIPVYNGARTIKRTLDNISRQTFKDFTILVYNDGSTDWTERMVRKAAEADSRICLINATQNLGRGAARNHLLQAAKGGLIAWQDADDTWHPSKLAEQIEFFNSLAERGLRPERSVVISTFDRIVMRHGLESATVHIPPERFDISYILSNEYGQCPFQLQSTLGLAESYLLAGGFDPNLNWAEDVDIALKIVASGQQIVPQRKQFGLAKYYHSLDGVDGDTVSRAQHIIIAKYRGLAAEKGIDIDAVFEKRRTGYLFNIYLENRNFVKAIYTSLRSFIDTDEEKLMTVSRQLLTVFRSIRMQAEEADADDF